MNIPGHGEFTIIGENIHTTRVVLRGGKLMGENPDGLPSVRYTAASGETRYLPIPEEIRRAQDYEEGRVKHVKVAVLEGMRGSSEALEYLGSMVARQLRAGSDFLDLNVDEVSLRPEEQKQAMRWLVRLVEPLASVPLSIDSSNVDIIVAGLDACEGRAGRPLLNSASLERIDALELARARNLPVIVTAAGESGMPQNDGERVDNASRIVEAALAKGLPKNAIYIDALVFPISVDSQFGNHCLEAIRQLRQRFGPEIHITGGMSNVSFGLPLRRLINDAFLILATEAGADSGIVDPVTAHVAQVFALDRQSKAYQMAEDVLLGRDRNCRNFLRAYRKGELQASAGAS
ncbi:MAG: hypothetical protein FJW37_12305 [Acidobacteria bacterium]|nr:hypothetical protein [Acidobacteriota bacterium]